MKRNHTEGEPEGLTFEQAYQKLEGNVRRLEEGSLALEESLHLFEEACKLRQQCEALLARAEAAIKKITMDPEGTLREEEFEAES
jgi:exodeoxyribonuclease VII small subunit